MWAAADDQPIASNALKHGAHFLRDSAACPIAFGDHDLQPGEFQFLKAIVRYCSYGPRRNALPLLGVAYPVADIAKVVTSVKLVNRDSPEQVIRTRRKNTKLVRGARACVLLTEGEP